MADAKPGYTPTDLAAIADDLSDNFALEGFEAEQLRVISNYITVTAAERDRLKQEVERLSEVNAALLAALEPATNEINTIRARDGAPQHIDWHRGQPIQTDGCTKEWWDELTEKCFAAIALANEQQ